ncbi:MAG: Rpn family recombination-promoting nuclease/putative transposase [Planctomycetaceae bacterium]|nr:Rpn family recombination-promoting nuclease/putative transposase [Planctomycetaceae bacterium]
MNLCTDFGFKKLFGKEANKDLLIDFLNAVLPSVNDDGIGSQLRFKVLKRSLTLRLKSILSQQVRQF